MKRKIIQIDEEKCNGCGLCVHACHEGAIGMVEGKAKLLREDYCDGLGDCLPACPVGAIQFVEREAKAYDAAAVQAQNLPCGCPSTTSKSIERKQTVVAPADPKMDPKAESQLRQWPVQIRLVPISAPYFHGADLLIAADCTAFAYADFHNRFMKNRITLVGCPKLDDVDYAEKLTQILRNNEIQSLTVVRMEVPCCGGLTQAVKRALQDSGKCIPWQVVTIAIDGTLLDR